MALILLIIAITIANFCYSTANTIMLMYGKYSALRDPRFRTWVPAAYYAGLGSLFAINATYFVTLTMYAEAPMIVNKLTVFSVALTASTLLPTTIVLWLSNKDIVGAIRRATIRKGTTPHAEPIYTSKITKPPFT